MICFLTVYEQYTWPALMLREVRRLGLTPVIIDNGSTSPPVVDWLSRVSQDECTVIRLGYNGSCYVAFRDLKIHRMAKIPFVVSDSDLDLRGVPDDAIEKLAKALESDPKIAKAGLSLEYEDIPEYHQFKTPVTAWESQFWNKDRQLPDGNWRAGIGATFALYDPARAEIIENDFYSAIRLDRPYTAKHLPWYLDLQHLTPELANYYLRCDDVAHWGHQYKRFLKERSNEVSLPLPDVQTPGVPAKSIGVLSGAGLRSAIETTLHIG